MFRKLLLTEFRGNAWLLGFSALINIFFVVLLALMGDASLSLYIGATTLAFYVHLVILAVVQSEEKRMRLYNQLPLSPGTVFCACWSFVLLWLLAQSGVWLLYALFLGGEDLWMVSEAALNMLVIIGVVSIAIDLFSVEPRLWRWLYLAGLALLLLLALEAENRLSPFAEEDGFNSFIDWFGLPWGFLVAGFVVILLLVTDYLIYTHSDNYLG